MASVEDGQVFIVSSLPGGGRGCIPDEGILKHLFGLTLVHYRELVCLQDVIVDIHLLSILILNNGLGFVQ